MIGRRKKSRGGSRLLWFGGLCAAAAYFFDPRLGKTRRAKLRDKLVAVSNRGSRKVDRAGRYIGAEAYGVKEKIAHMGSEDEVPPNDEALVAKVESEVLRGDRYPKGKINLNATDGVVYLRGQLDTERQISELEQEVRKITGVVDVVNLLHLPGEEAPNKRAARRSSK